MKLLKSTLTSTTSGSFLLGSVLAVSLLIVACQKDNGSNSQPPPPPAVVVPAGDGSNLSCPQRVLNNGIGSLTEIFYQQEEIINNQKCSTGPQQAYSLEEYCRKLLNDPVNNNCARVWRNQTYQQRCGECSIKTSGLTPSPIDPQNTNGGLTPAAKSQIFCTISTLQGSHEVNLTGQSMAGTPYFWDMAKTESFVIPHPLSARIGEFQITGRRTSGGTSNEDFKGELELMIKGPGVATGRRLVSEINSRMKIEIDTDDGELSAQVECEVRGMEPFETKGAYLCESENPQSQVIRKKQETLAQNRTWKPMTFALGQQHDLKFENNRSESRVSLTEKLKSRGVTVKYSVPQGNTLRVLETGSSTLSKINCWIPNASQ